MSPIESTDLTTNEADMAAPASAPSGKPSVNALLVWYALIKREWLEHIKAFIWAAAVAPLMMST